MYLESGHGGALDRTATGPRLIGHLARANPQWRDLADGVAALAIFHGPHAYVSPSWYATKQETGKVVPTWNYVAVHAYGRLKVFDDPDRLYEVVGRLTEVHEADRAEPWSVTDAPAGFIRSQLKGIVGLELGVERLEGKWKLSQNRPVADREGVIAGLGQRPAESERQVADLMRRAMTEPD